MDKFTRCAVAALIAPVFMGLGACADRAPAAADATVRDSAGITIVENAPGESVRWSVSAEPTLDIGVFEGDPAYQLYQVNSALRLSDGRIAVVNAGTHQLRIYDAQGRHVLSTGGQGDGPGEFEEMQGGWRMAGDSVLVYDWRGTRASVFAPDGSFARVFRLETGEGVSFPWPLGIAGGQLIARQSRSFRAGREESGLSRDSSALLRFGLDGTLLDTVTVVPGSESYVQTSANSVSVRSLPFGRSYPIDVTGDRLVGGDNGRPQLEVRTADGRLVRLIRWAQPERPVTQDDIAEYKARELESMEERGTEGTFRTMALAALDEMPYPQTYPAFGSVQIDELGCIWVLEASAPGIPALSWLVFDPDGRLIASVELPEGLGVEQIGADYVLGTWEDDLEVEHVRMYGLDRASAPASST